jgi:hypothetical protein
MDPVCVRSDADIAREKARLLFVDRLMMTAPLWIAMILIAASLLIDENANFVVLHTARTLTDIPVIARYPIVFVTCVILSTIAHGKCIVTLMLAIVFMKRYMNEDAWYSARQYASRFFDVAAFVSKCTLAAAVCVSISLFALSYLTSPLLILFLTQ